MGWVFSLTCFGPLDNCCEPDIIIDREGHARATVVELPSPLRVGGDVTETTTRLLLAPGVQNGSYSIPSVDVFSFGMLVIEVRHMALGVE